MAMRASTGISDHTANDAAATAVSPPRSEIMPANRTGNARDVPLAFHRQISKEISA